MKRLFTLILAAVMMLALVACGTSAPAESALEGDSETTNSTNVQAEPSTPVSDAECPNLWQPRNMDADRRLLLCES